MNVILRLIQAVDIVVIVVLIVVNVVVVAPLVVTGHIIFSFGL